MAVMLTLALALGLAAAAARAAYGLWMITDGGGATLLAQIGLPALAFNVLELHLYFAAGAVLGIVLAGLMRWRRHRLQSSLLQAQAQAGDEERAPSDPHERLRQIQRDTATRYLEERQRR